MEKICLIITFFSFAVLSYSSDYKRYKIQITDMADCNLYLYEDNHYFIEIYNQLSLDINETVVLSFGEYIIENGELRLIDKMNGYSQLFSIEKNGLKGVETYVFLKDKHLSLDREGYEALPAFFGFGNNQICSTSNITKIKIKWGIYVNKFGVRIDLQKTKKFYVYYDSIPLFGGYFNEYPKNKIQLQDLYLNHTFEMILLDENTLKGNLIIGKDNTYLFTSYRDYFFGNPFM